ncbi:26S proteasome chain protein (nucleomorph) [Cryptomonas paramecium]|uniref:26S proteasome chain protein n=1 Tax=Cryptomonas paramaecium TaxID=2898 RepID=F2HIB3_9CRYP|nr:26S proteasome chain protein [Cryptomonas paramecium]AEA39037.1 26S proteasome chain protein [Cryptomonas paramecium]|mmetsp:Transcript_52135/g.136253  ORF Transcript_52135/g.136253 Transcript_52135/m.136253 type:complete len:194 (+) Transcript_52135:4734-5315(+)
MDTVISLLGNNFGILVVNTFHSNSISFVKKNLDKLVEIGKDKLLVVNGYPGDIGYFTDFIHKAILFYTLKNRAYLSTHSIANFIRKEISDCFRNSPFKISMLLIGFDVGMGPSLYFIDYTGVIQRTNFYVQGYASFFLFSFLDKKFKYNMKIEEALLIVIWCITILKKRFVFNQVNFMVKTIDLNGSKNIGLV